MELNMFSTPMMIAYVLVAVFVISFTMLLMRRSRKRIIINKMEQEMVMLSSYADTVNHLYNEARFFKHDYKNVVLGMRMMIDQKDYSGIKTLFYDDMLSYQQPMNERMTLIKSLKDCPNDWIKGLLIHYYEDLKKKGMTLETDFDFASTTLEPNSDCDSSRILEDLEGLFSSIHVTEGKTVKLIGKVTGNVVLFDLISGQEDESHE